MDQVTPIERTAALLAAKIPLDGDAGDWEVYRLNRDSYQVTVQIDVADVESRLAQARKELSRLTP